MSARTPWPWRGLWGLLLGGLLAGSSLAAPPEGFAPLLAPEALVSWSTDPETFRDKHGREEKVVWLGRLESMRYEVSEGNRAKIWLLFEWLPLVEPGPQALQDPPYRAKAGGGARFGALMQVNGTEKDMREMQRGLEEATHYALVGGRYAGTRKEGEQNVVYIFADAMRLDDQLEVEIQGR